MNFKKDLRLLHQIVHLARPAVGEGDRQGVPALSRTARHRYLHNQYIAVVVLDAHPGTWFIAGDLGLTVESATGNCVSDRPTD